MAKQTAEKALSFKLGNFVQGGAGLQDGPYLFKSCTTEMFDYGGKFAATPSLKIEAVPVILDGKGGFKEDGEAQDQYYSAGSAEHVGINKAGTGFVALGEKETMSKSSNFFIFLDNVVNAGFPEDDFENDVSAFDGVIAIITNIAAPKRTGLKSNIAGGADNKPEREKTIPVPSDIVKLPGDKKCRIGTKAAAPKGKKDADEDNNEGGDDDAEAVLINFLTKELDGETKVARSQTRVNMFKAMNDAKIDQGVRDEAIKLFKDDKKLANVLAGIGDGFKIDGGDIVEQ